MKRWIDDLPQIPFRYRDLPPDGPWMTMEEAGTHLGIGHYHMNALTAVTHRIDMVRTTGKELAVTRASVEAEKHWRTTATVRQKLWRLFKDILKNSL
ncbi:DNA-binding protein [Kitasatospora sp. NPDC094011]|uniref:DNA-binding protein n=1 Tax=Kitasatospora sp. NPDC094011 TaxID=3364090 RepID=UPI00380B2864